MENENPNLAYYNQLRQVPQEAQKQFNNGRFSGTDINPMWRIKKMTEVFGICGIGWYYEVVNRHLEKSTDNVTICAFVSVNLYINLDGTWSKPIYGEGGNTFTSMNKYDNVITTDEAFKMALTDAVSNATKQLGLGADVWFERDTVHGTKYDQQQELNNSTAKLRPTPQPKVAAPAPQQIPALPETVVQSVNTCNDVNDLAEIWKSNAGLQSDKRFVTLVTQRKQLLTQKQSAQ